MYCYKLLGVHHLRIVFCTSLLTGFYASRIKFSSHGLVKSLHEFNSWSSLTVNRWDFMYVVFAVGSHRTNVESKHVTLQRLEGKLTLEHATCSSAPTTTDLVAVCLHRLVASHVDVVLRGGRGLCHHHLSFHQMSGQGE